ncbi:hypothetical protein C0995_015203 [Termitomyces sp. Mi166|nr:hypothetical protein C0995_015203 [Termitomyces sp. Mi166\
MDILIAYSEQKKWVTAKAGRPDIHRAGNAILRALAEGRIGWAFWPPDIDLKIIAANMEKQGIGIWIPRATVIENDSGEEIDEDGDAITSATSETAEEDSSSDAEHDGEEAVRISRFGALSIDELEEEYEEDEE